MSLTRFPLNWVFKKWRNKEKQSYHRNTFPPAYTYLSKAIRAFHRNGISSKVFEDSPKFGSLKWRTKYLCLLEGDLGKGGNHFSVQILLALYFMKSASISPSRKTEAENKHYGTAFIVCNFIYLMSIKAFVLVFFLNYFYHLTWVSSKRSTFMAV